jgi:hypothetical protein
VEIILRTASVSAAPLGLLEVHGVEVHRIADYRPFQPSPGGQFQMQSVGSAAVGVQSHSGWRGVAS